MAEKDSIIIELDTQARELAFSGKYFESAEKILQNIELKIQYQPDNVRSLASSYSNLGIIYNMLGQYDNALKYLSTSEDIYKEIENSIVGLQNIYGIKAYLYKNLGDYSRSQRYFQQALNLIQEQGKSNEKVKLGLIKGLAELYFALDDYDNAYKLINVVDSMIYAHPTNVEIIQNFKFSINLYLNILDKENCYSSLVEFGKYLKLNDHLLRDKNDYYLYCSRYYLYLDENLDSAQNYLNKISVNSTIKNDYIDPAYIYLNSLYLRLFQLKRDFFQLVHYSELLLNKFPFYSDFSISNPIVNNKSLQNFKDIALVIGKNVIGNYNLYLKHDNPKYLQEAYKNSVLLGEILDKLRWNYSNQSAEYILDDDNAYHYKIGQMVSEEFYRLTGEEKYLESAFEFNERAKAYNLLSSLRDQTAMEYGGIPNNLIEQESELNSKISGYRELIYTEEQKEVPNGELIKFWQDELFRESENHDKLVNFFEENYPEYFSLKFDTKVITTRKAMQNLRNDEAIIEYSILDSTMFIYVIKNDETKVFRQTVDSSFRRKCLEFYDILTLQSFSYGVRETFANYTRLGYELYTILIEPIRDIINGKNLIVIPDAEISYISFESLLSHAVDPENLNYYKLPYLIHEYGFSTSYSSTIHFTEIPRKKKPNGEILAFAPTYDNISSPEGKPDRVRQSDRDKLIRIPGVKEEVKKISQILDAKVYMDLNATETAFKENASDFKFLHLAMHTILNDATPLYSKLAFTQLVDSIDDGFLHTYEIYNLQLNADLAVLSSCSSGYGNLQEGEGLQSLARGFAYAGCPSILMTLWEVSDNSTVEVMEKFYHYLGKGYSKPMALHKAKIDFLKNADQLRSNPFFWSSFVLIGNTDPIYASRWARTGLNILLLLIPLPVFLILYRNYRKNEEKKNK